MEKYAHIPWIEGGVVFSDPWYDSSVWCQYRNNFNISDWFMKMDAKTEDSFVDFKLYLGRSTMMGKTSVAENLEDGSLTLTSRPVYKHESIEIGMDTASMFCGSMKNWEQFREEASLRTGTDGTFGVLIVLTCKGETEPAGYVLVGSIEEMFVNEEELFNHFVSSFDAREITREHFDRAVSLDSIANRILLAKELASATLQDHKEKPIDRGHEH